VLVAGLEHFGSYRVDARPGAEKQGGCDYLVRVARRRPAPPPPPGWKLVAEVQRPTERGEVTAVYRRSAER
jgi:hypothetical protein